ncbi:Syntaxin-6 [Cyphellophora attinorum]|uniref:t-SNARE affecting a late Golgi compartment protein 1 n=1 Tax=Cyphellophora attinorum TaxID=1664694 RepID=A0A0N1HAU7_9EURO|nr:Syntaxin-6 [Phialophora attinorum]KPI41220.1 Syntaxin-6 [Phialophora attinorum]
MASANNDDPFLSVQSDVQTTLTQTRTLFSSYLRIRTLASARPSQKSEELVQARTDLEENLATLSADLQDLLESIAAVEDDPYRFGLDTVEVGRRKGFVRETAGEVEGMRRELADQSSGGNNIAAGAQGLPSPGAFEDADYNAEFEQQQQQVMMEEQDQQLDGVFRSVGVLRNQAEDMGRELEEQGAMLEDVDTLADRVGGKLQVGVKRVGEVIRKNEDGLSSCCIAVLIFVLILLLILVIVI